MDEDLGRGHAERNPCTAGIPPAVRKRRDTNSIRDMFVLAGEIAAGDARRATLVSVEETRAIAKLCAHACLVVNAASLLLQASDAGAPKEALAEFMRLLADATRPFMQDAGEDARGTRK